MGLKKMWKNFLNRDSRPAERHEFPPNQTSSSTSAQETRLPEQQASAPNQGQAAEQQSQHEPPPPPPEDHPGSSPKQRPRRMSSAATPQHIAERYEVMERNLALDSERARAHGIAGYGSDAAAAAGASLQEVHQASSREAAASGVGANKSSTGISRSTSLAKRKPPPASPERDGSKTCSATADNAPSTSNVPTSSRSASGSDSKNAGLRTTDVPVSREIDDTASGSRQHIERHIHHVQHHIQPIIITAELPEEARNTSAGKERAGSDQATVTETVYHHIYHVFEPVIQKETADNDRVRTSNPMHQVIHEAPIAQRTQNRPITMDQFLEGEGKLSAKQQTPPSNEQEPQPAEQDTSKNLISEERSVSPVPERTTETSSVD